MKIAFDCSPLLKQKTGIGWYCYHLLVQFLDFTKDEFTLFSFSLRTGKPDLPEGWNTRHKTSYRYFAPLPRSVVSLLSRFFGEKISQPFLPTVDIAHFTNFTAFPVKGAKIVLTVHDLAFMRYPETI
ncbi:MAG: hypothetical protein H5T90_05065, partial [Acetomicrobium sp.]|nr:hypothetical protein [Acetomicrobium sp.]